MTDYLVFDRDGRLMFTADGRFKIESDADGPIELRAPNKLCCNCPSPRKPWAFGACQNLLSRLATLTTPNLYYDWYVDTLNKSLPICGAGPSASLVAESDSMFDLSIASITSNNTNPTTGAFSIFFRIHGHPLGVPHSPDAYTPLPWYGRQNQFAAFPGSPDRSSCEPVFESYIAEAGCTTGTEFRPDPVAAGEPGVRVVVGTVTKPNAFWLGDPPVYFCGRYLNSTQVGFVRLISAEAFIPARTGFTTWARRTIYTRAPGGGGAGIADVEGPAWVISEG